MTAAGCERANPWLSDPHLARMLKDCRAGDVQVSSRPLMRERRARRWPECQLLSEHTESSSRSLTCRY